MAEFNKKQKNRFWHSPLALLALFLVVVVFSYNMIGLMKKERETSKNKAAELAKIDDLRKREADLKQETDTLNTTEGVEETIRDKFQVVKPGEKMVVIVEPDQEQVPPPAPIDHSFWGFIKRLFGSK
jgi:cell division protein FtsB